MAVTKIMHKKRKHQPTNPLIHPDNETHLLQTKNDAYYDAVQSSDDFEYQDLPGPNGLYYMDPDEQRVPVTPALAEFDEFNALTNVSYTFDDPPHDANAVEAFYYEEPYIWQAPDA
jgi:hypothetical protein